MWISLISTDEDSVWLYIKQQESRKTGHLSSGFLTINLKFFAFTKATILLMFILSC